MNRSWLLVVLLGVVALLNYLDRQVIFSLLPLLRTDLELTDSQIGLLGATFLWVYSFCSLFAGWVSQRFGHRRTIFFSLCAWSVVTALTGLSSGFLSLSLTRAAMGITEAFYIPAGLALVTAAHSAHHRSLAVSLHQSGIYFGILLGGGPGAAAGLALGWRPVFLILGAIGICYAFVLRQFLPQQQTGETRPAPDYVRATRSICRAEGFWPIFLIFAAVSFANWMVATWMPLYLYDRFQFNLQNAGLSATLFTQVSGLGGMMAGGWMADRLSRTRPRGRIAAQTLGLLIGAVFLILTGSASTAPLLLGSLFLYSFGRGIYDCNVMPVLCDVVEEDERSTAYSLLNFAGTFVGGVAAYGAGALRSVIGLDGALLGAGVIILASAVLLFRIPTPEIAVPQSSRAPRP
ncbi:MAG TPA: MFS transporter [Bryobacteraceae bacterium]|nr:MFS transporter [Bryobacteraceae bacterium]